MSWRVLSTQTSKMSQQYRYMLEKRSSNFLDEIITVRNRATKFAAPQDVIITAAEVPLPRQTEEEEHDLQDNFSIFNFPWLLNAGANDQV
ncbi:hypothetical protein BGZ63DRAFT_391511 [Mariannaea sp. PMI_226]|nr:hypothetical protein BGZ63DRAFT_391511 [Mariannaea sp. PMI_226]